MTTSEVVTRTEYWVYAFTHQWSYTNKIDPQGKSLGMLVQQQANQSSGWLICEGCSKMFKFNKKRAKKYAEDRIQHPPGSGKADTSKTLAAAVKAWKKVFGTNPTPTFMF